MKTKQLKLCGKRFRFHTWMSGAQAGTNQNGSAQGPGHRRSAFGWRLLLVWSFIFRVSTAHAQFAPIPLSGGPVVKMVADVQRPYLYAIESPATGTTNGTLLLINATNGILARSMTLGADPTDIALAPDDDSLFVIDAGSRTITKVDLNSFTVVAAQAISTPDTYSGSNPLYVVAASSNLLYYTDGAWGPQIYSFNYAAGTNMLVFNTGGNVSPGAGGMVISPTSNSVMYVWQQYGWSAGSADSAIAQLNVSPSNANLVATGPQQARDPLDTPILMDAAGNWVFNKVQMVLATNVSQLVNQFGDNIYAITADGSLAFGPTEVYETQGGTLISTLPFSATVQAVSGDQLRLFCFNPAMTNIAIYSLSSLKAPTITLQPTSQIVFSGNAATLSIGAMGLPALYYYWNFNGTSFAVTTNNQMVITNFQPANSGTYSITVSNAFGFVTSSNFMMAVTNSAPLFLTQPASQAVAANSNCVFSPLVVGPQPIFFQWQFNGANINGATNQSLALTNVQAANAGNFDVVAANAFGTVTSALAYLSVMDVNAALNTTGLVWSTYGSEPWFVQANPAAGDDLGLGYPATHDGVSSMQSGNTAAGQQSILSTTVNGPATLTFWWQTASLSTSDVLAFSVGGQNQSAISGGNYWQQATTYLAAGTNLLVWDYNTVADPLAKAEAWLDQVSLTPGGTPPFLTSVPAAQNVSANSNATMKVTANGTPPFTYQWQLNGVSLAGATNATLTLTNLQLANAGNYEVVVANAFGSTNSPPVFLDVINLAQALNTTNIAWIAGGDVPWFVQTAVTYDGFAAAQSGAITSGQQSVLQTTLTGPGTLTYWWNVSSEGANDYLNFSVDGGEQARIFGVVIYGYYGWQEVTNYLAAGSHLLQWAYTKTDSGVSISGMDSGWVDEVAYAPGGTAPFVTLSPSNQVVLLGSNVTLTASALGTPPLYYQWLFNGTNVNGATNASLAFSNTQLASGGNYTLVVSNAFGVTNSATAFVDVVDLTAALNATNLVWTLGGNASWFPETNVTHDGVAAAQSGAITSGQQSTLQTTVTGPGTLTFWWKVSSGTNTDYANFVVDGAEQTRISGTVNWQQYTDYLTPGTHALAWNYTKTDNVKSGSDAAWLDQISYVVGGTAAFVTSGPASQVTTIASNATFSVSAAGTPPIGYQWYFNGNSLPGATGTALTLTNVQTTNTGAYAVWVTNNYGGMFSSNAILSLLNVYAWGAGHTNTGIYPTNGQCMVPTNLTGVTTVAAGGYHSMALLANGRVVAWGNNSYGQTNTQTSLSNAAAISAGLYHCLALRSNGTVAAWGYSSYSLTSVPASATNLLGISAGWYHNLALRSNGTVVAWGAGSYQGSFPYFGQTLVPTNLVGVTAVAAGGYHSLALLTNGTVVAWGWNAAGQTNVPSGLTNVIAIAAGGSNSLALKQDGTLVAWGANSYGQTNIPAGLTNVVAISAGAAHDLALRNDGSAVAWGLNAYGQTNIPAGLSNITAVSAGGYHNLALINVGPVTFLSQPLNQTIFKGSNATFSAACLGTAPINYQWLFNGANVPNATNNSLTVSPARLMDAGNYQLVAGNGFGMVTGAVAVLTVNDTAPQFILQPTNAFVLQNSSFTLAASATGLAPPVYQWFFNGTPVGWATNAAMTVTNAQPANQGYYSVLASNAYGTATSSNAFLDVIDLPQALGATNLNWSNVSSIPWFAESTNTHNGFAAAAVGPLSYGSQSWISTSVTGPGQISFWWSGGLNYGAVYLSFLVDGLAQFSQTLFSYSTWYQDTCYLGPGIHFLTWTAVNESSFSHPVMGFLDQVTYVPGTTPVFLTSQPASQTNNAGSSVTFNVGTAGTPPVSYQWFFDGAAIPGATESSLVINDVQSASTGYYSVTVSNVAGSTASSNATLLVTPSAPQITTQPSGGPAMLGSQISFTGGASGTEPLTYQWFFNGQPVTGATGTTLIVSNVLYASGGNYSLQASNAVGTALSSNAFLFAYSLADLAATLNNPSIIWSTTNVPWFPETNTTYDGVSAAQSGVISGSQQSTLQGVASGPATVTYWWNANCDNFWMRLGFVLNGTVLNTITGNTGWQQATNYIGAGSQTLQWNLYPVHGAFAGGTGWVDQVQIIPGGTAVNIASQPANATNSAGTSATLSVAAIGTPPLIYQWSFNGGILSGATNATLTLNNLQTNNAGLYAVSVTNAYGSVASSNATLVVNPSGPVITLQPVGSSVAVNSGVTFSVAAQGSAPLNYQWLFNTNPIPGATSNVLALAALQVTNSGYYAVAVSNNYATVVSTNVYLDVNPTAVMEYWPYGASGYSAPTGLGRLAAIAAGSDHTLALHPDGTVLAWGSNADGQTNVPAGLSNVVSIAAGNYFSAALCANGTVAVWGDNTYGETNVPAGASNIVAIAAGPTHLLALRGDGTVVGWGNDANGQVDVPAGLAGAQAIAAGMYDSFALLPNGSMVQWGNSPVWQHDGTNCQLAVTPGSSNVVGMAAASFSGWTLQDDGTVLGWGWFDGIAPFTNSFSYTGGGTSTWNTNSHPRNLYSGIETLAAGGSSGTPLGDYVVFLGNGGGITAAGPLVGPPSTGLGVPYFNPPPTNVIAIAAGSGHAVALVGDGTPHIVRSGSSRTVYSGSTVFFSAGITGANPLNWQWQFDDACLPGATNAWLVLTNVPLTAAGNYRCVASNALGAVTNAEVALTVLRSTASFNPATLNLTGAGFSWELDQLSGHGVVIIYTSTNLTDWTPWITNPPQVGPLQVLDATATNQPLRFYRAVEE